jgi:hypothetical protein
MSNAAKMTVEEKLVQHLKESALAALIPDEDTITELTKRAVYEALFKDRLVEGSYSRTTVMSPAVLAAGELAKKAADKVIAAEIEKLAGDDKFKALVLDALAKSLPVAIRDQSRGFLENVIGQASTESFNRVADFVRNGGKF